ncbi:tyrosine-type recombinase/integrase [Sphingomonas pruni]|uniref:tyrosine-type recombinase/integrase n=1 Tax=Sphingomonas pruni TaxID=40683 RepID=UPI00082BC1A0|nr:tyrosine-type recombinase/integrase [Sphingomonas pruni]
MARVSADLRLQDRSARARLARRQNPYWRMVCEGQHLGYYKGARGGTWVARYRPPGTSGNGSKVSLGAADDVGDANGDTILSWRQALDKATRWFELKDKGSTESALNPDITVGEAIENYIAMRNARRVGQAGREVLSDAVSNLKRNVLADSRLARLPLARLAEADLKAWQERTLRRRATIQRVVNDLKAALNRAWAEHRRALPGDLPIVIRQGLTIEAPGTRRAQARENQVLTDDQIRRVVAAALKLDDDFGRMVVMLAATGARFAQVRRMRVADVQPEQHRVMVPESYKGRRDAAGYVRVQVGNDTLAILAPAIEGRPATAPLLERWRHVQVKTSERRNATQVWERGERGPWATASEMARSWSQACRDAGLPPTTIPYALRHSSIVRGLRVGLPIRLVAALHDTSVAMIERHYSRWITEGLDELAARAVVPLVAKGA